MALLHHLCSMAMVSLVVLVIQNSLLVVMTRFSRKNVDVQHNYHTSTLVLNQECVKMLMCLVIYAFDDVRKQYHREATGGAGATTSAVIEVVDTGAPLQEEGSSSAFQQPQQAPESALTPPDGHGTLPLKDAGEAESEDVLVGASPTMRRNARMGSVSPAAGGPPYPSSSSSSKHTDASYPRKNRLRFAWMQALGACHLYCAMLRTAVLKQDTLKLLVPAFLFNLQNFLIFVGLSNLDAVSFQVWSQTKLLSTALFSVWLLHRRLSPMQWLSLVALTAGVLGAQLGSPKSAHHAVDPYTSVSTTWRPKRTRAPRLLHQGFGEQQQGQQQGQQQHVLARVVSMLAGNDAAGEMDGDEESQANALIGIAACVLSGLSSSYAGVYFEKVVKTTNPTLSIRNIQLSIFGIPLAFVSMVLLDVVPSWYAQRQCGQAVHWNIFANPFAVNGDDVLYGDDGACPVRPFYFWQRYDQLLTWGLVGIHAFGGLLVAIVVKYADNILKGFATGVAVIVSGMMSSVIWNYKPSLAFVLGAVLVIGSSIAFHKFEPKR